MRPMFLGVDDQGRPQFTPYRPWSEERKKAASIRAKKRIALKKKERLEVELKEVNALLRSLK